jgi:hypothetical protein
VTQKVMANDSTGSPVVVMPYQPRNPKQDDTLPSVNPTRKLFNDGTCLPSSRPISHALTPFDFLCLSHQQDQPESRF